MRTDLDPLSPFFSRFSLSARVFFTGALCRNVNFDDSAGVGYVHVLRRGTLVVADAAGSRTTLDEPAVLFFPGPSRHHLLASEETRPELVCASIEFGAASGNPLLRALPAVVLLPLAANPALGATVESLFREAGHDGLGRQAALDRLAEYFVILLLRHAIDRGLLRGGFVAGLGDPRLRKAIAALHDRPEHPWTLDGLAAESNMSRTRFAAHFRDVLGTTPLDYLTDWRISVAQGLLKRGKSLKIVAPAVGYTSATTLSRAFAKRLRLTPAQWLRSQQADVT